MPALHDKTVQEIISNLRQIFRLYRTRDEIDTLLGTESDQAQELNMISFMLWCGPRAQPVQGN